MLQEIEPEDEQFDDKEDMKDIQIKMEEEKEPEDTDLNDKPCKSTDLAEYPFIKELRYQGCLHQFDKSSNIVFCRRTSMNST